MVCRECGAYNDDSRQDCRVCAAPLHEESASAAQYVAPPAPEPVPAPAPEPEPIPAPAPAPAPAPEPPPMQEIEPAGRGDEDERPAWGFVRAPRWPQPTFDMNAVDDMQAPDPAEVYQPQRPLAPEAPAEVPGYGYAPAQEYAPESYGPPMQSYAPAPPASYTPEPYAPAPPAQSYAPASPGEYAPYDGGMQGSSQFDPQPMYRSAETPASAPTAVGGYEDGMGYTGSFGRAPQHAAVYSVGDREEPPYAPPQQGRKGGSRSRGSSVAKGTKPIGRGRGGFRSSRKIDKNLIFIGAAALLVILIIVFGIIIINKNYGGFGNFFSSVFGGSPILKEVETRTGIDENGVECYIYTVHVEEDCKVTTRAGGQEISGTVGKSRFMDVFVPISMLTADEPVEGATAEVAPEILVTTPSGEEIPLEVPTFTIDVPTLNLTIMEPSAPSISVSSGKVNFAGTVDDSSVQVFVNDTPITVNADGTFTGEYPLPDLGVYTLTLEARKAGYQIARQNFSVDFTQAQANVEFDRATLRADASGTATVQGTTDPGSTVSVTGPSGVTLGAVDMNAATGIFSFTADIEAEKGHYELTVSVTKDGTVATIPVVVERAPDYGDYTGSVHALAYSRMVNETLHTASYKCPGEVTEVIQTEPYVIAVLETADGSLVFEYHNPKYPIEVGMKIDVFGDYEGWDEERDLPKVYGWFYTDQ